MSSKRLRPAENLAAEPFHLKTIRTPRLTGWILKVAVWLLESIFGALVLRHFWRKAGIQQALREVEVPEKPSYEPVWPQPRPRSTEITIDELDSQTRAAVAAHSIPGFSALRESAEGGVRRRRWDVADFAQAYRTRLVTPTDVATSILGCLRQSDAADPPMRFLISQDPEDLLEQARAATARYAQGEALSPLDGVPYAVIDTIDAAPYPTTSGTTFLSKGRGASKDAPAVAALRRVGALLVGKSTMHELGISMTGLNPRTGTARNPYNPRRATGGAASGSAAIVSAGICAFALGVDGGGSVRVPAALCGVAALKPTKGRSSQQGSLEAAAAVMSIGTIAGTIGDVMLVNAVISNAGTEGQLHLPAPTTISRSLFDDTPAGLAKNGAKQLRGTKIGVYFDWVQTAKPAVLAAFRRALKHAAELGAEIVDVTIPELELARVAQMVAVGCEIAQTCKAAYLDRSRRSQMNLETRFTLASASRFLATDFLQAQKIRTRLMTHLERVFTGVDFIATPTTGVTAPILREEAVKGGESDMSLTGELMRFTILPNMSGVPATTVPIGHDDEGLPIGMQLIGQPWREAQLLYLSSAIESATRAMQRMPAASFDVLYGKL